MAVATEDELTDEAYKVFLAYMEGNILEEIVFEEIYNAVAKGITGATREEILSIAQTESAKLVDNIISGTQEGLAQIISDALENQIGVPGLEKELIEKIGLNAQQVIQANKLEQDLKSQGLLAEEIAKRMEKFTEDKTRERAETIARTEMRSAVQRGEQEVMASRGAKYKVWISTGDDAVSDECQANEAQGPIPIDEDFISGVDVPPQHPNCRCSVTFITNDDQRDRAESRANARAEATAQAKAGDDTE